MTVKNSSALRTDMNLVEVRETSRGHAVALLHLLTYLLHGAESFLRS